MARPLTGRPLRTEKVTILFTEAERSALEASAKRSGRTLSSYIRVATMKLLNERRKVRI